MKSQTELKTFAANQLARIYETNDYTRIQERLKEVDPVFGTIPQDKFGQEYLAASLALASISWGRACRENGLAGKESENILFKILMESFAAPKFLGLATAFSVYLHAPDASEKSVLAVMRVFFERLELKRLIESEVGLSRMHDSFLLVVEAAEGFRSAFENDFFEFVHS